MFKDIAERAAAFRPDEASGPKQLSMALGQGRTRVQTYGVTPMDAKPGTNRGQTSTTICRNLFHEANSPRSKFIIVRTAPIPLAVGADYRDCNKSPHEEVEP